MAKVTVERVDGWPMMSPVGKKEQALIDGNLTADEQVLGILVANFSQVVVATDHKVIVAKTGLMAGQTFGGKATSFDYHNIGAVEVRTGLAQGEMQFINPSMPSSQGNRNRDKVKVNESPNGVVFAKKDVAPFQEFASKVREMVAKAHGASTASAAVAPAPAPTEASIPDQIRQLGELHVAGVLTDEEFSTKKAELLSRM